MGKRRNSQEYSAEEFDRVVKLIRSDEDLRADIEAITGQTLNGRSARELFDLFRAIEDATQVQAAVVRFGQGKRALRQTRLELMEAADVPPETAQYVADLQAKVTEERRLRQAAEAALRQAKQRGLVGLPSGEQKQLERKAAV